MSAKNTADPLLDPADFGRQFHALTDTTVAWLHSHWLQILIAGGAGTLIFALLHFLRAMGHKLCARDTAGTGWWTVAGRAVTRTGNFFMAMLAAKLVVGYAGAPDVVATTITFLFTVAAVFQGAIWAREIILGAIEHKTASDSYHGEALGSALGLIRLLVTFALFAIALVVVLSNVGVNVSGLIAGLGVGGIAIGLAAQGIFADLFAALAIIFDRPFRRGDAIAYDQTSGTVEEIGLKSTRIRGVNGELRVIANKSLLDKEIQNNTRREFRRVKLTIGVAYQTPPDTLAAIPALFRELAERDGNGFVRAGLVSFGASSLDFEFEFDAPEPDFQSAYDARHAMIVAITRAFAERGITIPYPTQTTFTAAPDGHLVMPYAAPDDAKD